VKESRHVSPSRRVVETRFVVIISIYTVITLCYLLFPGQLSLAIPPWAGAMNTGDGYGHRYGRIRRVLRSISPCDQYCRYIDLALAVKLSWPSGRSGSYTGLIGFNPRRLKGPKRGMSSHATDLTVYAKSSIY